MSFPSSFEYSVLPLYLYLTATCPLDDTTPITSRQTLHCCQHIPSTSHLILVITNPRQITDKRTFMTGVGNVASVRSAQVACRSTDDLHIKKGFTMSTVDDDLQYHIDASWTTKTCASSSWRCRHSTSTTWPFQWS